MRVFVFFSLLGLALTVWAADIEDVLREQRVDADAATFMPRVNWIDKPAQAYYQCTDRYRSEVVAHLWQGEPTQIQTRNPGPVELIYGELGSIKVYSHTDKERRPSLAAYLLLPSGETHLFRVSKSLEIVKSSMQWQCNTAPYRTPSK